MPRYASSAYTSCVNFAKMLLSLQSFCNRYVHQSKFCASVDPLVLQSGFGLRFMLVWRILGESPADFSAKSLAIFPAELTPLCLQSSCPLSSSLMGSLAKGFLRKDCGNSVDIWQKSAKHTSYCVRKAAGKFCGNVSATTPFRLRCITQCPSTEDIKQMYSVLAQIIAVEWGPVTLASDVGDDNDCNNNDYQNYEDVMDDDDDEDVADDDEEEEGGGRR